MSFAPNISPDDKRWLAFTFVGAFIGAACVAACALVKTETSLWLQRRRDAKNPEDGNGP